MTPMFRIRNLRPDAWVVESLIKEDYKKGEWKWEGDFSNKVGAIELVNRLATFKGENFYYDEFGRFLYTGS